MLVRSERAADGRGSVCAISPPLYSRRSTSAIHLYSCQNPTAASSPPQPSPLLPFSPTAASSPLPLVPLVPLAP